MNINSIRSIRSRAAWLKAAGVLALAPLLPLNQADAFAPQDSRMQELNSKLSPATSSENAIYNK